MWLSWRACYSRLSKWGKLGEQSIVENYNCLPNQLPFRRIVKPITLAIGSLASANTPKSFFFISRVRFENFPQALETFVFLWLFATLSLAKLSFKTVERVENRWQVGHRVLGGHLTYPKNCPCPKRVFLGSEQLGEQRLLKSFCSEWRKRYSIFEKKLFSY